MEEPQELNLLFLENRPPTVLIAERLFM